MTKNEQVINIRILVTVKDRSKQLPFAHYFKIIVTHLVMNAFYVAGTKPAVGFFQKKDRPGKADIRKVTTTMGDECPDR